MLFVTNGNVFFTSNLEYNNGSWWHLPSLFMARAPVFLILTASFTPQAVQSVFLAGNFTLSQSMVWFSCTTWSIMVEGCTSVCESFFLDLVKSSPPVP